MLTLCEQRAAPRRQRGRYKQHNRQLTSALTQLAHPGKEPEIRLKATSGRAAEPVLRLPRFSRLGDVALSPACKHSCSQLKMSSSKQARLVWLTVAWRNPLCAPLAGSAHSSHRRCAPLGGGGPKIYLCRRGSGARVRVQRPVSGRSSGEGCHILPSKKTLLLLAMFSPWWSSDDGAAHQPLSDSR